MMTTVVSLGQSCAFSSRRVASSITVIKVWMEAADIEAAIPLAIEPQDGLDLEGRRVAPGGLAALVVEPEGAVGLKPGAPAPHRARIEAENVGRLPGRGRGQCACFDQQVRVMCRSRRRAASGAGPRPRRPRTAAPYEGTRRRPACPCRLDASTPTAEAS